MKTLFKYRGIHSCEAVVLTCIDFRFWRETVEAAEKELGLKNFDFPSFPGGVKAINESRSDDDLAMKCISVPCDLHHAKKIVLVNHQDCGAYGGSAKFNGDSEAEMEFHKKELKNAKEKIIKKYPAREVILMYAKLVDEGKNIELLTIS